MQEKIMRSGRFADYIKFDWQAVFDAINPKNGMSDREVKTFLLQYIEALRPIYLMCYQDEARYDQLFPDHFMMFMANYEAIVGMVKFIDDRDPRPALLVETTQIWRQVRHKLQGTRLNKAELARLIPRQTLIQAAGGKARDLELDEVDFYDEDRAPDPRDNEEPTQPIVRFTGERGRSRSSLRVLLAFLALSLSASNVKFDRYRESKNPAVQQLSQQITHSPLEVGEGFRSQR